MYVSKINEPVREQNVLFRCAFFRLLPYKNADIVCKLAARKPIASGLLLFLLFVELVLVDQVLFVALVSLCILLLCFGGGVV